MTSIQLILLAFILFFIVYFIFTLVSTIKLTKKIINQRKCKLHTWVSKDVYDNSEKIDTYIVCSECKLIAGSDYYEETP